MKRMKTFFMYFLAFVILYVVVDLGSYLTLKSTYIARNYEVNLESPKVTVNEFKSTILNGYINGTITNDTDEVITGKALKFDYYSKNDVLVGTKYFKVDNLLQGESKEFESKFNFDNVDDVKISLVDSLEMQNVGDFDFSLDDFSKDDINWFVLLGALIVVFT